MRAGQLRKVITLQKLVKTQSDSGAVSETPQNWRTVRAAVYPLSGREIFNAQQQQADVTHRVLIRFLAGVTSDMQISYAGRVLQIVSVTDSEERHRELTLM